MVNGAGHKDLTVVIEGNRDTLAGGPRCKCTLILTQRFETSKEAGFIGPFQRCSTYPFETCKGFQGMTTWRAAAKARAFCGLR